MVNLTISIAFNTSIFFPHSPPTFPSKNKDNPLLLTPPFYLFHLDPNPRSAISRKWLKSILPPFFFIFFLFRRWTSKICRSTIYLLNRVAKENYGTQSHPKVNPRCQRYVKRCCITREWEKIWWCCVEGKNVQSLKRGKGSSRNYVCQNWISWPLVRQIFFYKFFL